MSFYIISFWKKIIIVSPYFWMILWTLEFQFFFMDIKARALGWSRVAMFAAAQPSSFSAFWLSNLLAWRLKAKQKPHGIAKRKYSVIFFLLQVKVLIVSHSYKNGRVFLEIEKVFFKVLHAGDLFIYIFKFRREKRARIPFFPSVPYVNRTQNDDNTRKENKKVIFFLFPP